jgi:sugar phosphate permease
VNPNSPASLEAINSKVMRRLLPFLLLMYLLAFLDRANIGFAQKALQHDTGLSNAAFAFGAGVFFIGYALFEVPSNLLLHRVGARVWMCRIMVTWGLVSASMCFAHTPTAFYTLRFLLGVAEAGFFPGVIYYLTHWFPQSARARAVGVFYFGAPLAFIFGSPLSGLLLELHGAAGLAGWQWLFLIEGGMATAVGVWAFWYLDNRPEDARWLDSAQRVALRGALDEDALNASAHGPRNLFAALLDRRVLALSAIYLLIQMSVYGVIFYLPQQVAALLGTTVGLRVGLVAALPWLCALGVTWLVPRRADRTGGHRRWAVALLVLAGLGIGASVAWARCAVLRGERIYRRAAVVLGFPHPLSDGCGGRGRHRPDQLARRPGRLYRAVAAHRGGTHFCFDLGGSAGTRRGEPAGGVADRHAVSPGERHSGRISRTTHPPLIHRAR